MSVYKPAQSRFFQYDFVIRKRRFHGSTGQETRRAAQSVERKLRQDAAEGRLGEASRLTLDQAADKWWLEVGQHRGDSDDVFRRLKVLLKLIDKTTVLADISTKTASEAIQRRRGMAYRKAKGKGARRYLPSNATVNRDVIETLRPILNRARVHWEAKGLPAIAWKNLKLAEPRETVRVYSKAEQVAWDLECGATAALALRLVLRYGLRLGELFFPLDAFDPDTDPEGALLTWLKGRKRDIPHAVPLLEEDAREVAARVGRARQAELEHIWYAENAKGELEPLSYYALQGRLRRASKRAGVAQGRVIHGARHHAGTTMMRQTKDMKLVQKLLGHVDPKSTHRYVHAMTSDLRAALNAGSSQNSPEATGTEQAQDEAV